MRSPIQSSIVLIFIILVLGLDRISNAVSAPTCFDLLGKSWIQREVRGPTRIGNPGLDLVANPALYEEIVSEVVRRRKFDDSRSIAVADFGAGTLQLAKDLLREKTEDIIAFDSMDPAQIENFRSGHVEIVGFEASREMIQSRDGEGLIDGKTISAIQIDLAHEAIPFSTGHFDIEVSRNFLMYLSPEELRWHLSEARRALQSDGAFFAVILNPEYQRRKALSALPAQSSIESGQSILFPHNRGREQLPHHYHSVSDYLRALRQANFQIMEVRGLSAVPGWESEFPKYYDEDLPPLLLIKAKGT